IGPGPRGSGPSLFARPCRSRGRRSRNCTPLAPSKPNASSTRSLADNCMTTDALRDFGRRSFEHFQRLHHAVRSSARREAWARRLRLREVTIAALSLAILSLCGYVEYRTSVIQSHVLPLLASRLTWSLGPGASAEIHFPRGGPFDVARGYSEIPLYRHRLAR